MIVETFCSALFFTLLGVAYVKGYDVVKSRSPQHLVQFYLLMATVRLLLVGTMVALYVVFADNRENAIHIAAIILIMYVMMMAITLYLRH